jgi:hypothetical protein
MTDKPKGTKTCPECGHRFRGFGYDGIDAHWKSKHEKIMAYEKAWPLIRDNKYSPVSNASATAG